LARKEGNLRVLEFQTQLNPDHTLTVPRGVAQQIQADEELRVMLFVPDAAEDQSWAGLTAEQFLNGYSDGDSIYDSPLCPI
jgi:hypothetical protein